MRREGKSPFQPRPAIPVHDPKPKPVSAADAHEAELLDEALKQTFPASDPIAIPPRPAGK